jgi:hypothetical protein
MCNEARVVNESNSQVKYSYFDDLVLLGYDVMSLSDRFPTSRENILHDTNASPLSWHNDAEFRFSEHFKTS